MKFGKSLSLQIEGAIPEWRDKFLRYKELKKGLKSLEGGDGGGGDGGRGGKRVRLDDGFGVSVEEIDFVLLLEAEVEKFNGFFEEKEEEYIIRLKELQDDVARAKESSEELIRIRKEIVDFHGEMVLLENYSAFNFTGLVKILKKYDKRTGALIRLPFIQKVLRQPFFTLDLLYKLIKECEILLDNLFPICEPSVSSANGDDGNNPNPTDKDGLAQEPKQLTEMKNMESLYMKSVLSAIRILKDIRSGSSTVSAFSLPPLQSSVLEETWNKIPILEQVAK